MKAMKRLKLHTEDTPDYIYHPLTVDTCRLILPNSWQSLVCFDLKTWLDMVQLETLLGASPCLTSLVYDV